MTTKIIIYLNVQATSQAFDGLSTPAMVSIGCVSQAGEEFYAELSDTFAREECSVYVQQRVLPLLEGMSGKDDKYLMTETRLAQELKSWIESFGLDNQVKFFSLNPKADWHFIQILFDNFGWPENLYRFAGLIKQTFQYMKGWHAEAMQESRLHDMRNDHSLVIARRLLHAHNVITDKFRARLLDVCTRYSCCELSESEAMQLMCWTDREILIKFCNQFELPVPVPVPTPALTSDFEIFRGMLVFTGTRVPITAVFENLAGGLSLDDIQTCFPALKREQAMHALRSAGKLLEQRYVDLP
jgi:uncharacterized protein (DUF433 family)